MRLNSIGKKSVPLRLMEAPPTKMLEKRIAISKTKKLRFMIGQIRYNVNTLRKMVMGIRNYSNIFKSCW